MRVLIAEDDFISQLFMRKLLYRYGEYDIAADGMEAIDVYLNSINEGRSYDLICLDIMMPKLDGMKVLKAIRRTEKQRGISPDKRVKVIMTTAVNDREIELSANDCDCNAYVCKPIKTEEFILVLRKLSLIV